MNHHLSNDYTLILQTNGENGICYCEKAVPKPYMQVGIYTFTAGIHICGLYFEAKVGDRASYSIGKHEIDSFP